MQIYNGSLDVQSITNEWYDKFKDKNCGALITFVGIVREEGGISALSFDIYEPILKKWLDAWQERAKKEVVSPQRKVALRLINEFVEDFKANAPIWKYDVINGERIYAKERSQAINGAGLLA